MSTPTCERVAIGTERDDMDRIRMPLKSAEGIDPYASVPQADRFVLTPTCERPTIRTEHNAKDNCMPLKSAEVIDP